LGRENLTGGEFFIQDKGENMGMKRPSFWFPLIAGLMLSALVMAAAYVQDLESYPANDPCNPAVTAHPNIKVNIQPNVVISDNAVNKLKAILASAGLTQATISSGRRSPAKQAQVMYDLIENRGVGYAKDLYGRYGDQVIDVYCQLSDADRSNQNIISEMTNKINALGPSNVSKHCSRTHDTFDVPPSSIDDKNAFAQALREAADDGTISSYICPPKDPVFHIVSPLK
jgi:hypothetical protein